MSADRQTAAKMNIPLGGGIDNVQLLVLNEWQQLAALGELGEIYIRTPYLAKGYLKDDALTRKRFVLNPFTMTPQDRLYRTGDSGYRSDRGVEFVGRNDQQVTLRGYRIELGEIEAALRAHRAVEVAVVSVHVNRNGDKRLVAHLVLGTATTPLQSEWRGFLEKRLPEYMLPSFFITLDALPLTSNGKIDRNALPAPDQSPLPSASAYPGNRFESGLAEIWGDVLGLDKIDLDDDFFDLGGQNRFQRRQSNGTPRRQVTRSITEKNHLFILS